MSRVAKKPIELPSGVELKQAGQSLSVKGPKGELSLDLHDEVSLSVDGNVASLAPQNDSKFAVAITGTMRSLISNMVEGVSTGFQKKLELVGVGYRAQAQGQKLNLTLGFSHPVVYEVPADIKVETPSQTEILVSGANKQVVGQVAAEIRAYRPPEPYKGKGVRYADEHVVIKEAKKK